MDQAGDTTQGWPKLIWIGDNYFLQKVKETLRPQASPIVSHFFNFTPFKSNFLSSGNPDTMRAGDSSRPFYVVTPRGVGVR